MTTYTPQDPLSLTGTSLTGTDGTVNRTYTFSSDDVVSAQMEIMIAGAILQLDLDYTWDVDTVTVTFLNKVWDTQPITINYLTAVAAFTGTTEYTTTLDIARSAGIGVEVAVENIGTGDGSANGFDTDFGNIIADSYLLYYAVADSNDFINLIEVTDYTLNKNSGAILLTTTGLAKTGGKVIYADYTYSPRQSDTVLASYLPRATAEVEKLTGNYWGTTKSNTEYFDGYEDGYPRTDRPYTAADVQQDYSHPEFILKYQGISAVTPVYFLAFDGTVNQTPTSDQINYDDDGRVIFNLSIPNGKRNIKITYDHGYTSVPVLIQELTALVGGMMALVNISGGSYKDVSTYALGRKSFSIGQIYVNVQESIKQMKARIEEITDHMGYRYAVA